MSKQPKTNSPLLSPIECQPNAQKEPHAAEIFAEGIYRVLFQQNKLGKPKPVYKTSELWELIGERMCLYFDGRIPTPEIEDWVFKRKGHGRVQVINALFTLLEEVHKGDVIFIRLIAPQVNLQ